LKQENIKLDKTYALGLRIIKLYNHLREQKVERDLCLQLLRSGTSIGANTEEAIGGSSRKDFVHKLEIAYRGRQEKQNTGYGFLKTLSCLK
jgi:four helix bundle protein